MLGGKAWLNIRTLQASHVLPHQNYFYGPHLVHWCTVLLTQTKEKKKTQCSHQVGNILLFKISLYVIAILFPLTETKKKNIPNIPTTYFWP